MKSKKLTQLLGLSIIAILAFSSTASALTQSGRVYADIWYEDMVFDYTINYSDINGNAIVQSIAFTNMQVFLQFNFVVTHFEMKLKIWIKLGSSTIHEDSHTVFIDQTDASYILGNFEDYTFSNINKGGSNVDIKMQMQIKTFGEYTVYRTATGEDNIQGTEPSTCFTFGGRTYCIQ